MDSSRFDALAKSLAAQHSRRGVLGAFAGALLGAAGLSRSADAKICRALGNSCTANGDCCSNNCVTESRTRKTCQCASAGDCPAGDQCHTPVCAGGACGLQVTVDAVCDDSLRCTINDRCQPNGSCAGTPVICDDHNACTTDACNPATGQCTHTAVNCNDGNACTIDTCDPVTGCGHTAVVCPPALNECFTAGTCQSGSGLCSNPVYHGDQATCSAGVCHANACCTPEDKAATCAGGKCGPQTNNCGQTVQCLTLADGNCAQDGECCSGVCVTDAQGLSGICQTGPASVGENCDSNGDCASHNCCSGICRDVSTDPDHCGACATVCSSNNMATRTCGGGVCNGICTPGFADCNGNKQTDGCEVDILHDHQHCGNCSTICPVVANGDAVCSNGTCAIACHPGFTNCFGQCIDLDTDPDHCGACATICSNNNMATRTCSGGVCNGTCTPGFADCNGNKQTDGCEKDTQNDAANCGGCGSVCPSNPANGSYVCSSGACTLACSPGFTNCSGVCKNLSTDSGNCGSCGHVCSGPSVTCGGGGTPGVCGCTAQSNTVTCGSHVCGSRTNNCGASVSCGSCGPGFVCASDGTMCKNTSPSSFCVGRNTYCPGLDNQENCGQTRGGSYCSCIPTVEGGGFCSFGLQDFETPCTSSADCPGSRLCAIFGCNASPTCIDILPCV